MVAGGLPPFGVSVPRTAVGRFLPRCWFATIPTLRPRRFSAANGCGGFRTRSQPSLSKADFWLQSPRTAIGGFLPLWIHLSGVGKGASLLVSVPRTAVGGFLPIAGRHGITWQAIAFQCRERLERDFYHGGYHDHAFSIAMEFQCRERR